jgi:hypothetical protein
MSLNPEDKKNWQGFLDLLQPPPGYRLGAAIGTTFGLSMDALMAALLSMCDTDGEELASNPVAATMAITRLSAKVRVLVHPATITIPSANTGSNQFIALLDRLVVEVQPAGGLFHPKVWALRFEHIGPHKDGMPAQIGRVLVGSRNLTRSTCFELGAVLQGNISSGNGEASEFGADVARALREWLTATNVRYPDAVWRMPNFVARLTFDVPHEAEDTLRLRWQGIGQKSLADVLPKRLGKTIVVSPFLQPDFVMSLFDRTNILHIVSIPESLDGLPEETIALLNARAEAQQSPVLYQVADHGNPDDSHIDGIHAKAVLIEDQRQKSATFVGSANATGPGWGLAGPANVEAMIEMRPGIGIDQFISGFIRESKTKIHPWISEYDRNVKPEPDPEKETERHMLAALREVAKFELTVRYDDKRQRLTLSRSRRSVLPPWVLENDRQFFVAPYLLTGTPGSWRPISELQSNNCHFDDVPLSNVTAFVALRAQSRTPPLERQRFVLAKLEMGDSLLEERDERIRVDIMSTADPAMVLNALVRGLAHVRTGDSIRPNGGHTRGASLRELLAETTLERLLQAVALDPSIVAEMRLLLGPLHGEPMMKLCNDLEEVSRLVDAEEKS